jgi:hypothetical protein
MLYLLVVLPELLLLGDILREEMLLRLDDLGVIVLVGVLLIDREGVEILEDLDLVAEDCLLREADEDLEACWLLELLSPDLLLLLDDLSAKTGSMVSIKAKNNVPTTILTFL